MRDLATVRIGSVRYNSPTVQVCLLGFVVFWCVVRDGYAIKFLSNLTVFVALLPSVP